jgi:hypothetical protein
MIWFRKIRLDELVQYAHEVEASTDDVLPITLPRAESQTLNPKGLPHDIVLVVAYNEKNQVEGYAGALPEKIGDTRCAWNSGWWVKPGAPSTISFKLLFELLAEWDQKLLFSELTPTTSVLVDRLGFCKLHHIQGFRGYLRFCLADLLPRKKPCFARYTGLLKCADRLGNFFINMGLFFFGNDRSDYRNIEVARFEFPLPEDESFLRKMDAVNPIHRTSTDFQWIARYPWVVSPKLAQKGVAQRYYFSYAIGRFETGWMRFSLMGKTAGLVAYTIRNQHLKLNYVFVEPEITDFVGRYFYSVLKADRSLCTVTTFHQALAAYFASDRQFLFITRLPKMTAQSKTLIAEARSDEFVFQMGDGDCIFT